MVARDTGSPRADAENDFLRVRRRQVLAAVLARIRHDPTHPLPFEEVVDALGRTGSRPLGTRVIPVDKIIGSVDKIREFDHRFRPTSGHSRERWEWLARAVRVGEGFPPIDVYQLGDRYFVRDGHHRVSVSRALGFKEIEAVVTVVRTALPADRIDDRDELERTHFHRLMLQRVPLTGEALAAVVLTRPLGYARLAEMIESWATRVMHREGGYLDKETIAARWYAEEFTPTLALLREAHLVEPKETLADAYIRVSDERYRLIRAHIWNGEVVRLLRQQHR